MTSYERFDGPSGDPGGAASGQPGPPTCVRHPDRETGVRCNRCERPICHECMQQAAVGFQCPDCVAAGRKEVRAPRTVYGGRVPLGRPGAVTITLIAVNAVVWLLTYAFGYGFVSELSLVRGPALDPNAWGGAQVVGTAVGPEQWYRMLTAMFLHQQVWHIGMNMLALWTVGPQLEVLLGRARFLGLYLASGLGGAALFVLTAAPGLSSLGASGAIFGLFGAVLVLTRRQHYDLKPVLILIAINLAITFGFRSSIDWRGHVGGLVVGILVTAGLVFPPRRVRPLVQGLTFAGALLLAVLAAVFS
ncbi:hypothetical protein BIV57_12105 [Mangrovactinospora gilvigrisea]|uniref:Peptidase S54 rhomboid domain-containing protein n=1 Tax=Mangrovactinospora gilvigrisea TaxID=1428644 RepID=A0A1J7C6R2_9ACTN|nr:rhomboid family intramembrane serine protease [Mangrovactinospora gilvigrisea]OIV37248.1 hypothetical protein BIV57_12105 [Mangrovactinospora gilvigrisea]